MQPVLEYASPVWDPFIANNINAGSKVGKTRLQKISMRGHHATTTALANTRKVEKASTPQHLLKFYKFHQGLIHIESRHCPSKSRRTTQHTHNLTYNSPSNRTAYDRKPSFLGPLTSVCSLLDL